MAIARLNIRMSRSGARLLPAALAAAGLLLMPMIAPHGDWGAAAYAKNGNSGGNGGHGGKGAGQSHGSSKQSAAVGAGKKARSVGPAASTVQAASLSPNELGKWNAAHANQAALNAHIANQNFNGTIGALAEYQLAAKAAAGEPLSEAEQSALEGLIGDQPSAATDAQLADALNANSVAGDPVFEVNDGIVSCTANCDGVNLADAQAIADAEAAQLNAAAEQTARDDLLAQSEQRIIDESNKPVAPDQTDAMLDQIAGELGVPRPSGETAVVQ